VRPDEKSANMRHTHFLAKINMQLLS
jgi:hypothetical protein